MLSYSSIIIIITLYYHYTYVCNCESLEIAQNRFFNQMTNMVIMEKTSLQSKFGHYDAKNAFYLAFSSSYDHNQSLIVMEQCCNPLKVDDCCVMLS